LKSGFLQQSLDPESRKYTAFTIPGRGQFQFKVSCFGSTGAPSSFSKLMDYVLSGLPNTVSYIDDILIFSRTHDHLKHLNCLRQLRYHNIKISIKKSLFATSETNYLGFHIMEHGIRPGADKLKCVRDFPPPDSIRKISQFIGLASFFREHIPNFSSLYGVLTRLIKKGSGWTDGPLPKDSLIAFRALQVFNFIHCHCISTLRFTL